MIVIADSGSTKTDWKIVSKEGSHSVKTLGFNPVLHTDKFIYGELQKNFEKEMGSKAAKVYYYGSGCWDDNLINVVKRALKKIFTQADIEVQHDLLGAARASCGKEAGIACILGTGSNSCLFDGKEIIDNVTNLGYLLGDEGSGTFLGKMLIRAYFYRELPKVLVKELEKSFPGGKASILKNVYGDNSPNVYLASFTRFLNEFKEHIFIQKLLYQGFESFIDRHVRKYEGHYSLPVHFIGSVGYYFQEIIKVILEERSMNAGRFIQKPIDYLVQFHASAMS